MKTLLMALAAAVVLTGPARAGLVAEPVAPEAAGRGAAASCAADPAGRFDLTQPACAATARSVNQLMAMFHRAAQRAEFGEPTASGYIHGLITLQGPWTVRVLALKSAADRPVGALSIIGHSANVTAVINPDGSVVFISARVPQRGQDVPVVDVEGLLEALRLVQGDASI